MQPYEVFSPSATLPAVPIMINANGAPRPAMLRCYRFGQAVGTALRSIEQSGRVLLLASGGMSHWVAQMSADHPGLAPETRDYVIGGRARAREHSAARDAGLVERLRRGVRGRVAEDWDRRVLAAFEAGDPAWLCAMPDDEIEERGGNGSHELRAWLALMGAWGGPMQVVTYEAVPEWIAGMGCVAGWARV